VQTFSYDPEPGVFPYTPSPAPSPEITPDPARREEPGRGDEPGHEEPQPNRRVTGKTKGTLEAVKEMGATPIPEVKSNIHCLTIVGQIEGHLVLPPQNKTTKYEHIIPQLVALEQAAEVEGILIVLNTVGGDIFGFQFLKYLIPAQLISIKDYGEVSIVAFHPCLGIT
jgi:hypothetical protein